MEVSTWLLFVGITLISTSVPGPGVLLAVSNSLSVGARFTIVSSFGNASGLFASACMAMLGIGVLLTTSPSAFWTFKIIGALYLIYLGIRQCSERPGGLKEITTGNKKEASPPNIIKLFIQGFGVAITNPKAMIFFAAFFPQFLTHKDSYFLQFLILIMTFISCTLIWHAFYVVLIKVLGIGFERPRRVRLFNYAAGTAFVALGISILTMSIKPL